MNSNRVPKVMLGARLHTIRKKLKMNQTDLAQFLGGCTQAFVSAVEKGKSAPSLAMLAGVERLGYSPRWLLTGQGPPELPTEEPEVAAADCPPEAERLPILRRIPADFPESSSIEGYVEGFISLPPGATRDPNAFCFNVPSDSMAGVVEKDDLVVVSPALRSLVRDNDLVVARLKRGDSQVRRFAHAGGYPFLVSPSPCHLSIRLTPGAPPTIIGKVIYHIHRYK